MSISSTEAILRLGVGSGWLVALLDTKAYPKHTPRCGKWLAFLPPETLDGDWQKLLAAFAAGLLGRQMKRLIERNDEGLYPTCIYTYDYDDERDVSRIGYALDGLRLHVPRLTYKSDAQTLSGEYSQPGKPLALYGLPAGGTIRDYRVRRRAKGGDSADGL